MRPLLLTALVLSLPALAKPARAMVPFELDGKKFESVLVYDDAVKAPRPGLVLVPNWLGINEANLKQAELVAGKEYVVLVADVYGLDGRPKTMEEAGKAAGGLTGDRALLRTRVAKSLALLLAEKHASLDAKKVGAIGFCFGGTTALELARMGAKVPAIVTFHAGLSSPRPDDAKNITGRVLVLHGADDPNVPPDEVKAFEDEMRGAKVDWQLHAFGGAVHSFTDVDAHLAGNADYNPKVAKQAYAMMREFLAETWAETR
jgi:dienelactone hydrolase